jgi:hypothetical protein
VTAIPWPPGGHSRGQLGYLRGQVSLEELDSTEDRPVISSVVIASGKNEPSHGYWAFVEEISESECLPLAARPSG